MKLRLLLFITILVFGLSQPSGRIFANDPSPAFQEGIENISISVYPNPTEGRFTLELGNEANANAHLQIVNLIGKRVWERQTTQDFSVTVDLSHLPKGVYFLQVRVDNQTTTRRIILQ